MKAAFLALLVILCAQISCAEPVIDSNRPSLMDIPQTGFDGTPYPKGGLVLHATTVGHTPDGHTVLMYGFIIARSTRENRSWSVNTTLGLDCRSTTHKTETVGKNTTICYRNGTYWFTTRQNIPKAKLGRLRGTLTVTATGPAGTPVTSILSWAPGAFPDPAPLIKAITP